MGKYFLLLSDLIFYVYVLCSNLRRKNKATECFSVMYLLKSKVFCWYNLLRFQFSIDKICKVVQYWKWCFSMGVEMLIFFILTPENILSSLNSCQKNCKYNYARVHRSRVRCLLFPHQIDRFLVRYRWISSEHHDSFNDHKFRKILKKIL